MHMEQRMVQTQSQHLMLTQKMQQALMVLQLSTLDLEQHVQEELETNPVLEQALVEAVPEPIPSKNNVDGNGHDTDTIDDTAFDLDDYASRWDRRMKEGRDLSINPDMGPRRDRYENSITKEESLVARLMTQLRLAMKDEKRLLIGEYIIGDIDDRGYFTGSLDTIAEELGVDLADVEKVLYRIQRFEPTGVGARDVVECLSLQINVTFPNEAELYTLVAEHFVALQHRQIPQIAKAMSITAQRVEKLKDMLALLDPWPGHEYSSEATQYIIPDLIVEKIDDDFVVSLSGGASPELTISDEYKNLSKSKGMDKKERAYLREKMESAKWLIRNIEQRQQTILRIGKAIMDVQRDFLEKGVEKIRPLTLQEIADIVGVHEATVSRTTRGKYAQTPQGLFELKYFFSPGLQSETGAPKSSKSVQSEIRKIIGDEEKKKPLSDQKIADMLKGQGLKIARRTVTKYREGLNIPATTMRKEY